MELNWRELCLTRRGLLFTALGSGSWKILHISLSGKNVSYSILPECHFLSGISAHSRPLVKWIAFHSNPGLKIPYQPGFLITQTQSVSWHQVVFLGRFWHVLSGLWTSGIWKGQIDEREVRTKKVQSVPKFRLPDHTEFFAIDICNYFHLLNLKNIYKEFTFTKKNMKLPPKCPSYLNV